MKKFIILFLTLILSISSLFGCNSNSKEDKSGAIFTGVHKKVIKETDDYLLKNGATNYQIVIPQNASENEILAAQELLVIFKEGTNVNLPLVSDVEVTYTENSSFISIGETSIKEQAGVTDKINTIGVNGYVIKTVGNCVFIVGGYELGVLYGTYEFLYQILNFEQFFIDSYNLDKMVTDIPLMNYDIKELPDITRMLTNVGGLNANPVAARRMRVGYTLQNTCIWVNSAVGHTSLKLLPTSVYQAEHNEWYSDDLSQLCYTAHGVPEEYEAMIQEYTNSIISEIKEDKGKLVLNIGDMDVLSRCQCDACNEYFDTYKCANGSKIIFCNQVMDRLNQWFETEEGKEYYNPSFSVELSAYYYYEDAPAVLNEKTGEYEPIDEKMMLKWPLSVHIAPIFANFTQSYFHDSNISYYNNMKAWQALFDGEPRISFWTYGYIASNFMYFINTMDSMQEHYQIYASFNPSHYTDQSQGNNYNGLSAWYTLKTYLQSKLAWDTNANISELTQRFFDNYYGEASDVMMKFYNSQRTFNIYQQEELGYCNAKYSVKFQANNRKYWNKAILENWRDIIAEALEKIEPLKVKNPEKYQKLYKHIVAERVAIDFILFDLYSGQLGDKYSVYLEELIEAVKLNNISYYREESGSMTNFINNLQNN